MFYAFSPSTSVVSLSPDQQHGTLCLLIYAPYRALLTLRRNSNTACSDWLLTFCKPFIISAFYLISNVTTYFHIFVFLAVLNF